MDFREGLFGPQYLNKESKQLSFLYFKNIAHFMLLNLTLFKT